jgi:hypothetical protein
VSGGAPSVVSHAAARRFRVARLLAAAVASGIACWLAGFAWFVHITAERAEPPPHADGIIALTGGAGRMELALRLLAEGRADRLLLSGIGGHTELSTLGRLAGIDTAPLAGRIALGRYAESTRGNGAEAAAWAQQNGIGSAIVVTAAYHMPRALAEMRRALPGVRLFALAVAPVAGDGTDRRPGLRLQAEEFAKYVFTVSGLSSLLPRREGGAPVAPGQAAPPPPAGARGAGREG